MSGKRLKAVVQPCPLKGQKLAEAVERANCITPPERRRFFPGALNWCRFGLFLPFSGVVSRRRDVFGDFRHGFSVPLLAARCRLTPKKPYRSLHEQAHQLLDGERQNAKHQVAHDLVVAANPDELAAEVILEPSVGPLDGAPFVVADILGQPVTGALSPPPCSPRGSPPGCRAGTPRRAGNRSECRRRPRPSVAYSRSNSSYGPWCRAWRRRRGSGAGRPASRAGGSAARSWRTRQRPAKTSPRSEPPPAAPSRANVSTRANPS